VSATFTLGSCFKKGWIASKRNLKYSLNGSSCIVALWIATALWIPLCNRKFKVSKLAWQRTISEIPASSMFKEWIIPTKLNSTMLTTRTHSQVHSSTVESSVISVISSLYRRRLPKVHLRLRCTPNCTPISKTKSWISSERGYPCWRIKWVIYSITSQAQWRYQRYSNMLSSRLNSSRTTWMTVSRRFQRMLCSYQRN